MKKILYIIMFCMLVIVVYGFNTGEMTFYDEPLCFPDSSICAGFFESLEESCRLNLIDNDCVEAHWSMESPYGYSIGFPNVDISKCITCENLNDYKYECYLKPSSFLTKSYFIEEGTLWNYYYADIENVVYCPYGCDKSINRCKNGIDLPGEDGYIPDCSEEYMKCENNNVYICAQGKWSNVEDCGNYYCKERSTKRAECERNIYYCINNNFECVSSSENRNGCYDTISECSSNIPLWCLTITKDRCVKRYGSCLNEELQFKGTDLDSTYEECATKMICIKDDQCDVGFYCDNGECKLMDDAFGGEPNALKNFLNGILTKYKAWGTFFVWLAIIGIVLFFGRMFLPQLKMLTNWLTPYIKMFSTPAGGIVLLIIVVFFLYLYIKSKFIG